MPSFGEMEDQGQFGASEAPGEQQGLFPADRSGIRAPGLDEGLRVHDDPAYQTKTGPLEQPPMELAPDPVAVGAPQDGIEDVMRPMLRDAFARIAPNMGITFALSVMMVPNPNDPSQAMIAPTLAVEMPAPILGRNLNHGLQFMQMANWTQEQMDDVVRNIVEVLRQQQTQLLNGAYSGGLNEPQRPSGLIVPGM